MGVNSVSGNQMSSLSASQDRRGEGVGMLDLPSVISNANKENERAKKYAAELDKVNAAHQKFQFERSMKDLLNKMIQDIIDSFKRIGS